MKSFCFDTHALIWAAKNPAKLGRAASRLVRDVDAGKAAAFVPASVLLELALLREAGRKTLTVSDIDVMLGAKPALSVIAIDLAQAREFALLDRLDDPFDRLVVAAARVMKLPLVTADNAIDESGLVDVIWD